AGGGSPILSSAHATAALGQPSPHTLRAPSNRSRPGRPSSAAAGTAHGSLARCDRPAGAARAAAAGLRPCLVPRAVAARAWIRTGMASGPRHLAAYSEIGVLTAGTKPAARWPLDPPPGGRHDKARRERIG